LLQDSRMDQQKSAVPRYAHAPLFKILIGKNQRQNTGIAATGIIGVADI